MHNSNRSLQHCALVYQQLSTGNPLGKTGNPPDESTCEQVLGVRIQPAVELVIIQGLLRPQLLNTLASQRMQFDIEAYQAFRIDISGGPRVASSNS